MIFTGKNENKITEIPVIKIRPNKSQPRKHFPEDELKSLARSIEENGVIQPLTVRRISPTEYELITGERRLRASALAGMKKVPCIVVRCTDKESAIYALLENLQRADLGIFEEARGISKLIRRFGLTQEQAAEQLGKTQSTIANKLRLLRLTYEEQEWITRAGLSERHARALLKLNNESIRREALSRVINDRLNVSQTEALVGNIIQSPPRAHTGGKSKAVIKDIRIFANTINKAVDTMRMAGINAETHKSDNENYIEYTIRIPKSKGTTANRSA